MKSPITKIRLRSQVTLIAILVAVGLLLANFFFSRHFVRLDLTEEKEYTLSESTKKILSGLTDQVVLKLYFTKKLPTHLAPLHQRIMDLLDEYRVHSHSKISIEQVAPDESPQKEQEAQMLGIPPLQVNVIEKDKQEVRRVYLGMALLYADKKEVIPVAADVRNLEYDLTSSILKLTSEKVPRLGLMVSSQPSGEGDGYDVLEKVLEKQVVVKKYEADATNFIDDSLDALVVVGPHGVDDGMTKALDELFQAGTPIILLTNTVDVDLNLDTHTYDSGLTAWLENKGITVSSELLIEPLNPGRAAFATGFVRYYIPYPFFVRVSKDGLSQGNPITAQLEQIMFPWANTISFNAEGRDNWKFTSLAQSSKVSFLQEGEPLVKPRALENLSPQPGKKHTVAAIVEAPRETDRPSRLVVVANTQFLRSDFLRDYDSNILFLQNMIDWVSWGEDLIGIRSRGKTDRPLAVATATTISTIRWAHLGGLPLIVVGMGFLVVFVRRRKMVKIRDQSSNFKVQIPK